jgi:hypothetical protein
VTPALCLSLKRDCATAQAPHNAGMIGGDRLRGLGGKGNLQTGALDRVLARVRRPLDRRFERHAGALDGMAALSADVGATIAADPELVRGTGPRVLVVSLRGWSAHDAYEMVIAHALRLRGAQVALLTCGGGLPVCELGWARTTHPRPCDRCAWLTDRVVEVAGLRHYALRERLLWGADPRNAPAEPVDGGTLEPYGASAISVVSLLKSTQLERVARAPEIVDDFAVAASGVEHAATAILDELQPQVVFLLNGLFAAERVIRESALARGIRSPTYESAPRGGALVFSQHAPAPDYNVEELWAAVRDRPLTSRQRSEVVALLRDRARGVGAHESYFDRIEDDRGEVRRRLDLGGKERVFSLFTNVTWDSAAVGHDIGFASLFDWVEHAVRLAERSELVLVIRIHPAEAHWSTREALQDVIVSRLGDVPENVRFVSPDCPLSSYALVDMSELVLTYTTTVGLEAATRGARVAVAGDTHYRGRGFTIDVSGPDDLARVFALEPSPPSADEVELALSYAHMFFFRAMIPFSLVGTEDGKVRRFPHSATELAPGADPYLDWICERILDGEHFGLPDDLAVASPASG